MREKLTRGGMALRREPASYECPFCLRPVGIIGNWLAKLFGTQMHGCDFRNTNGRAALNGARDAE